MKKETYLRKLDIVNAKVTDKTTVAELKVQAKARKELERFWKKAAIAWMEQNVWHKSFVEFESGWQNATVEFNLKPGGSLKVLTNSSDFSMARGNSCRPGPEYKISKKELLS